MAVSISTEELFPIVIDEESLDPTEHILRRYIYDPSGAKFRAIIEQIESEDAWFILCYKFIMNQPDDEYQLTFRDLAEYVMCMIPHELIPSVNIDKIFQFDRLALLVSQFVVCYRHQLIERLVYYKRTQPGSDLSKLNVTGDWRHMERYLDDYCDPTRDHVLSMMYGHLVEKLSFKPFAFKYRK